MANIEEVEQKLREVLDEQESLEEERRSIVYAQGHHPGQRIQFQNITEEQYKRWEQIDKRKEELLDKERKLADQIYRYYHPKS